MNFLVDLIKGIFVGVANVIPGVSGGTMAVSFGIYDKLLSAIASLFKDFKNSIKTLLPIALGMVIGIGGFTFVIGWLLENQPFATSMAFTGLILGGVPAIFSAYKDGWNRDEHKSGIINIILFVIFAAIVIGMLFMNGDENSGVLLTANLSTVIIVFFMGIIASATMIIPGVSGSLVLMILGYYFGILSAVKDFITALKDMDISAMLGQCAILVPFAIGCVIGIFGLAKLIKWLFERCASATYAAISGLIAASPFSIFYKVSQDYSMGGIGAVQIIIGVIALVVCAGITIMMGNMEEKN
jgi:putative membrane protein